MASTARGTALTETHRLAQIRLKTATTGELSRMWDLFDIDDPFRSWARIEPAVVQLVQIRSNTSTRLADRYFTEFHAAERAPGRPAVRRARVPDPDDLIPNLRLLGPVYAERNASAALTFSNVASEVARQVLAGGRSTITDSVRATPSCQGYYRVSDGAPCAFCALLIGRGAVYSEDSGDFEAHRGCGCTAEPLYRDGQPHPNQDLVDEADAIYAAIPDDVKGDARIAEFRARYRAQQQT